MRTRLFTKVIELAPKLKSSAKIAELLGYPESYIRGIMTKLRLINRQLAAPKAKVAKVKTIKKPKPAPIKPIYPKQAKSWQSGYEKKRIEQQKNQEKIDAILARNKGKTFKQTNDELVAQGYKIVRIEKGVKYIKPKENEYR